MTPTSVLLLSLLSAAFILISAQEGSPGNCGRDQVYKECGSACPANCTHPNGVPCIEKCVSGCFCKEGYVKSGSRCIKKEKCCTGNMMYTECGTACPITCSNRFNPPKICTLQCFMGCICKPGYIYLDGSRKKCIRPKNCPKIKS